MHLQFSFPVQCGQWNLHGLQTVGRFVYTWLKKRFQEISIIHKRYDTVVFWKNFKQILIAVLHACRPCLCIKDQHSLGLHWRLLWTVWLISRLISLQGLFCRLTQEQRELYQQYLDSSEVQAILAGNYKVCVVSSFGSFQHSFVLLCSIALWSRLTFSELFLGIKIDDQRIWIAFFRLTRVSGRSFWLDGMSVHVRYPLHYLRQCDSMVPFVYLGRERRTNSKSSYTIRLLYCIIVKTILKS